MRSIMISGIAALGFAAVSAVTPTLAQTVQTTAVGSVVHEGSGALLGTITRFEDGGRVAVIETPAHFFPGSRLVGSDQLRVPVDALAEASNGHAVRSTTAGLPRAQQSVN